MWRQTGSDESVTDKHMKTIEMAPCPCTVLRIQSNLLTSRDNCHLGHRGGHYETEGLHVVHVWEKGTTSLFHRYYESSFQTEMEPNIKPPWTKKLAQLPKYYSTEFALTEKKQSCKASLANFYTDGHMLVNRLRALSSRLASYRNVAFHPCCFFLVRLDHKTTRMGPEGTIRLSKLNFLA